MSNRQLDLHSGLLRKPPLPRTVGERNSGNACAIPLPLAGGEVSMRSRDGVRLASPTEGLA